MVQASLIGASCERQRDACEQQPRRRPFIIGVAGGTASGKTSVCRKIIDKLVADGAACGKGVLSISQDCFYKDLTLAQREAIAQHNFDHPDAFDFDMIASTLHALRRGAAVDIPIYDFVASARCAQTTRVETTEVILFDGILALYEERVRDLLDLRIFVDADADLRLARRLRRDIVERGRQVLQVLNQYEATVKPSFDSYILPTKRHADIIVPRGAENTAAIDLIWQNIRYQIQPPSSAAESLAAVAEPRQQAQPWQQDAQQQTEPVVAPQLASSRLYAEQSTMREAVC